MLHDEKLHFKVRALLHFGETLLAMLIVPIKFDALKEDN